MKANAACLALACALVVIPAAGVSAPAPAGLQARLQRLEDVAKINALMQRYFYVFDSRDFKAYSELFTEDGELACCGNGQFKGRAAILDVLTRTAPDLGPGAAHTGADLLIDVKGDTATSRSRWTVIARAPDGRPGIVERGHYEDVLVRGRDGEWRFKSRRVVNELRAPPATAR